MQGERPVNMRCERCGAAFHCGAAEGACWCFDLPHIPMPAKEAGCLCPACLRAEIAQRTADPA